jgi:hypothetical protein
MGNYILGSKKILLRCNNRAMNFFHENLLTVAKEMNYISNKEINEFISLLDQDLYGLGCIFIEINDIFHSEENLVLLKELIQKTIQKIKQEKICTDESLQHFEKFNNEFIEWLENR